MREVDVSKITDEVKRLCIETNRILPADLEETICKACKTETNDTGKAILNDLCRNMDAAREMKIPICQDTGMAVVFVEVGQDVHFIGGDFEQAIHEGVRQGYVEGLLRLSVVGDPLERKNTNDNTPAVIHTRIVPGDKVELMVAPKGFGSENMSRMKMFTPSATKEDIIDFVVETAKLAEAILVLLWCLVLVLAEILNYVLILLKRRCAVKYQSIIQKKNTVCWNKKC